jgi:hypothetical protein
LQFKQPHLSGSWSSNCSTSAAIAFLPAAVECLQTAAPVRQLVQQLQRSDARHEAGILQPAATATQA